jgi:formylglycine-generating enzyme required for sulfatase activity
VVRAELDQLGAREAALRGSADREALAAAVTRAKEALERGDLEAAARLAGEAEALAERLKLDPAPAKEILDELRRRRLRQELAQHLRDFVKTGSVRFCKYEVTNSEYLKFCLLENRRSPDSPAARKLWPKHWEWSRNRKFKKFPRGRGDYPVRGVSFGDAQAYCAHLSGAWKVKVRLPTEEEWVEAATGGKEQDYPWGSDWDPKRVVFQRSKEPMPVRGPAAEGLGGASPYGILHMAGNVSEWVDEVWVDPEKGRDLSARVLKGGSFRSFRKELLQVGHRERGGINEKKEHWGFRVVVELD